MGKGASLGEEVVLATSGRAGEVNVGGRAGEKSDFFSSLLVKTVVEKKEVAGEGEENTTVTDSPDAELDLRGVICPYNFVKTKLKLEAMEQGQILSVLLDDGDPIRNVPRSVSNEGHTILSEDRVEGSYRVVIRRREDE